MKKIMFFAAVIILLTGTNIFADEVRIGLSVSDSIIKNTSVTVGFAINDDFYDCYALSSSDGFRIEKGSYSEADTNVFSSYEQAKLNCRNAQVPMLRSKGNWAVSSVGTDDVLCVYSGNTLVFTYKNSYPLRFKPADKDYISLSSGDYRGSIEYNINMKTINVLDINEYLYSVVPSEMPSDWHIEALKAQALAARSYAKFSSHNHQNDGFELCDTSHCQVYTGMKGETQNGIDAVEATRDEYIFYDNEVINAVFHSSSGGYTNSSLAVWNNPYPYLVPVPDTYDTEGKKWSHTYSLNSLSDEITGQVTQVILKINQTTKRVAEMTLKGSKQDKVIAENQIRSYLPELESTIFSFSEPSVSPSDTASTGMLYAVTQNGIVPANNMSAQTQSGIEELSDSTSIFAVSSSGTQKISAETAEQYTYASSSSENIILYGRGWGHGVGMSQFGAKGMAENGFDYKQIITHYYTGTEIKK